MSTIGDWNDAARELDSTAPLLGVLPSEDFEIEAPRLPFGPGDAVLL